MVYIKWVVISYTVLNKIMHWVTKRPGMKALFSACLKQKYTGRVVARRVFGVKVGDDGGRALIARMGWHPRGLSVPLLPLSSPAP